MSVMCHDLWLVVFAVNGKLNAKAANKIQLHAAFKITLLPRHPIHNFFPEMETPQNAPRARNAGAGAFFLLLSGIGMEKNNI